MTPDSHRRASTLFTEARHLPGMQIAGWLEAKCGRDPSLMEYVWMLLRYDAGESAFLEKPARTPLLEPATRADPNGPLPASIGSYRVISCLGEGGHGTVYLAEQASPNRTVAIKVLRWQGGAPAASDAGTEILRRFERERDIIAAMDHPGIAQILDAGTTDLGVPFIVLEYVPGERITSAADRLQLSIPDRILAWLRVCEAVAHAHERGVIHRDLTPGNILLEDAVEAPGQSAVAMAERGGEAVKSANARLGSSARRLSALPSVKVIDFGIAKIADAVMPGLMQGFARGVTTDTLARPMGTPAYMSPEQARADRGISVRADVYSLGVVLFELLSGTVPFHHEDPVESINRVRDPNLAAPTITSALRDMGVRASEVASCRGTDAKTLERMLERELTWILQRALEKDPARRYASVADFADDLRAYLGGERPVKAAPPSAWYRARKYARRNRRVLITAGAVGLPLFTAAVWMYLEARQYWIQSSAVANHSLAAFQIAAEQQRATGTPEGYRQAAMYSQFAFRSTELLEESSGESGLTALAYWADALVLAGDDAEALPVLERSARLQLKALGDAGPGVKTRYWQLALAQVRLGRFDDAEVTYRELLHLSEIKPPPTGTSGLLMEYAGVLEKLGKANEAASARAKAQQAAPKP